MIFELQIIFIILWVKSQNEFNLQGVFLTKKSVKQSEMLFDVLVFFLANENTSI